MHEITTDGGDRISMKEHLEKELDEARERFVSLYREVHRGEVLPRAFEMLAKADFSSL